MAHRQRRGDERLPRRHPARKSSQPRIYDLAYGLVARLNHPLEAADVRRFVNAYQLKSVLTLAELWAVPVMLNLALIEKLSDAAERTAPRWHGPLEDALRSDLPNEPRENGAGEGVVGDIIQSLRAP